MKIISLGRRHYRARVSIFLVTLTLIIGLVGCSGEADGGGPVRCDLNITSTDGGSVTTPGEGTFTYNQGTIVSLVATAEEGYYFVNWTGNINFIADVDNATTTITMNGHSQIKANFRVLPTPMVAAGDVHTVGLKADGTVIAVGDNQFEQCDVGNWTDITQVAAGSYHTVGVRSDGTVVAVGSNGYGQCDVDDWTDIIQVAAGRFLTLGLKDDGIMIATSLVVHWNLLLSLPPLRVHPPPSPTPPNQQGCFIATAAYGTPMAEEIRILREFRDEYLLTNPLGQALVYLYYRVSPPIAEFITEYPSLKPIVKAGLLPAVAMATVSVNTTGAEKIAIVGVMALVSVALAVWATGRRSRKPDYT